MPRAPEFAGILHRPALKFGKIWVVLPGFDTGKTRKFLQICRDWDQAFGLIIRGPPVNSDPRSREESALNDDDRVRQISDRVWQACQVLQRLNKPVRFGNPKPSTSVAGSSDTQGRPTRYELLHAPPSDDQSPGFFLAFSSPVISVPVRQGPIPPKLGTRRLAFWHYHRVTGTWYRLPIYQHDGGGEDPARRSEFGVGEKGAPIEYE
ncbi:hypothetical protein C8F04DRAFT_1186127 [Mycena alexandri]|uniref:Uncharacterized protein n=1 Tax=Mycena alexandri TaxID=1745969 RepID=A0AAD6SRQ5_9AGAR|nr:hypothetical protein C8F04DRAFT_1186127 [Mycena alexandri]